MNTTYSFVNVSAMEFQYSIVQLLLLLLSWAKTTSMESPMPSPLLSDSLEYWESFMSAVWRDASISNDSFESSGSDLDTVVVVVVDESDANSLTMSARQLRSKYSHTPNDANAVKQCHAAWPCSTPSGWHHVLLASRLQNSMASKHMVAGMLGTANTRRMAHSFAEAFRGGGSGGGCWCWQWIRYRRAKTNTEARMLIQRKLMQVTMVDPIPTWSIQGLTNGEAIKIVNMGMERHFQEMPKTAWMPWATSVAKCGYIKAESNPLQ